MKIGFNVPNPFVIIVAADRSLAADIVPLKIELELIPEVTKVRFDKNAPKQISVDVSVACRSTEDRMEVKRAILACFGRFFRKQIDLASFEALCESEELVGTLEE